jgi:branched-chain amino acid transport system permease protein
METRPQATFCPPPEVHRFPLAQYLILFLILFILPFLVPEYLRSMLGKIYIFAIFAMSLNLVLGYTGLISLGHAAYLGVGGYTVGILMTRFGIESLWIVFPMAIVASAIVAAFIGCIALRVSGMHFILITIAFGQLLYAIAVKWRAMTGSTDGLIGINYPAIGFFGFQWTAYTFHFLILLLFVICCLLMYLITNSSFGYALIGIRENEPRMQGLGYHTWLFKYMAFIIGGAFAGVAGALFAPFYGIMVPSHFGLLTSSMAVLMVVLGSPGTLYGPLIGSFLIVLLEFFASIYSPERWPLILGGTFIICITLFRGGLGIYLARVWAKASNPAWKS